MKIYKLFKLEKWEIVFLIFSTIALVLSNWIKNNIFWFSTLIGVTTCIITAIIILYFQRIHKSMKLRNYFILIAGMYIRTDIGQDNTIEGKLIFLKEQNNNLQINLTYLGENKFIADMEYWKSENAKAVGIIEFSETNKMIASGTYKYYQGSTHINHFGTLELFRFEEEPNKIYVKYQHVFPRKSENNPDNNRGWQIWERK